MENGIAKIRVIYDAVDKILTFTENIVDEDELTSNIMVWDAVKMNLVVIYETYLKLTEEDKKKFDFINWQEIEEYKPRLENQLIGFDSEEIWITIHTRMPEFKQQLGEIIE